MPRASTTSADPHFELMLRLPCLATRTPAPATTKAVAVEMLKVPLASPPVPLVSTNESSRLFEQGVAAGAGDGEGFASVALDRQGRGGGADRFGEADDLLYRLAFHAERDEQCGDLRVGALAGQDLGHYVARFVAVRATGDGLARRCRASRIMCWRNCTA